VTVRSLTTGDETHLDADIVVCATGYSPADPMDLLGDLARYVVRDEQGVPETPTIAAVPSIAAAMERVLR
jgi:lysine/ornithine N-monooxygenase